MYIYSVVLMLVDYKYASWKKARGHGCLFEGGRLFFSTDLVHGRLFEQGAYLSMGAKKGIYGIKLHKMTYFTLATRLVA